MLANQSCINVTITINEINDWNFFELKVIRYR